MTFTQLIYDLGILLVPFYRVKACAVATVFFSTFGGISTALWSNLLTFILAWVIVTLKSFQVSVCVCVLAFVIYLFIFLFLLTVETYSPNLLSKNYFLNNTSINK